MPQVHRNESKRSCTHTKTWTTSVAGSTPTAIGSPTSTSTSSAGALGVSRRSALLRDELRARVETLHELRFTGTWTIEFVHGVGTDHDTPKHLIEQAAEDLAVLREMLASMSNHGAAIFDFAGVLTTSPAAYMGEVAKDNGWDLLEVMPLMLGPLDTDGDHPWHRLERGEISFDQCSEVGDSRPRSGSGRIHKRGRTSTSRRPVELAAGRSRR